MLHNRIAGHRRLIALTLALCVAITMVALAPPAEASPPTPSSALTIPPSPKIGEPVTFTVSFDNTDTTDTGYGPYVDLYLPTTGADGAPSPDGLTFTSATYLGVAVTTQVFTFGPGGSLVHPYTGATITGTPGDQFVVLELPFGSFTPTQPVADITVTAALSNLADLGTPLTVRSVAGFRFGDSPTGSTPIVQPVATTANVTPSLVTITKTCNCPEGETSTGPNFPRSYTVTVDVATGQTLTNLQVTDALHNTLAYLSVTGISPAGSATTTPAVGVPSNAPNNRVVVTYPSVTGTASATDAQFTINYFAPRADANGVAVLDAATGAFRSVPNSATGTASWTPIDTRDPVLASAPVGTSNVVNLEEQSISIRKSVSDLNGGNVVPGDVLEYTIDLDSSDFFAWQDVSVSDTFSDGQRLDTGFTPTFTRTQHGSTSATAAMNAANFGPTVGTGPTTIGFRVSDELVSRGLSPRFIGGCVPAAGTGGPLPSCSSFNAGQTTARIRFRTIVNLTYNATGLPVVEGDALSNSATVSAANLHVATLAPTGSTRTDDTAAGVALPRGTLSKSVYALNGAVVAGPPPLQVTAGDVVTYRFTYTMPQTRHDGLTFTDFLPRPLFDATELTGFDSVVSAAAPAAGRAKWGPSDTYNALTGQVPSLSTNGTGNSMAFTLPAYAANPPVSRTVDILFSVTASSAPFVDELLHTNLVRSNQQKTGGSVVIEDAIIQVRRGEPLLDLRKGVVATDKATATFVPAPPAPVSVTAPGSAGFRFGGTLTSTNLAGSLDSDLTGVDAGDRVTFALVVENTGTGRRGAFDVALRDALPTGYTFVSGSLNVSDGTGAAMTFADLGGGLFGSGIRLDDPGPTPAAGDGTAGGSIDAFDAASGRNLAVITYDATLNTTVAPGQVSTNTATLFAYAGCEGCADHVGPGTLYPDQTDTATTTVDTPVGTKTFVATSEAHTADTPAPPKVAIGEIVRYRLAARLPEGTSTNVQLLDNLPTGMTFLDDGTARVAFVSNTTSFTSTTITTALSGCTNLRVTGSAADLTSVPSASVTCPLPDAAVSSSDTSDNDSYSTGTDPRFKLGTITNADNDANDEFVIVEYSALVDNSSGGSRNVAGTTRTNGFQTRMGSPLTTLHTATGSSVLVVEPAATLAKTRPTVGFDAGDPVGYQIVYTQSSGANTTTAFDVRILDTAPAAITGLTVTAITPTGGATGITNNSSGNTIDVTIATMPPGATVTITYSGTLAGTVSAGQSIANTATATWTSLPGTNGTTSNPTGSSTPGSPGSGTGERTGTGSTPNLYTVSSNQSFTIGPTTTNKSRVSTSESTTSGSNLAIGEISRYRLQVRFPEGVTSDVRLVDAVPNGLQVLDDGTARVAFVSNGPGITSSAAGLSGAGLNVTGNATNIGSITPTFVLPAATVTGGPFASGTDVSFNLGTVTNDDRDADEEYLVVEYNALVLNEAANVANRAVNNSFAYRSGTTVIANSGTVNSTVRLPSITTNKTASVANVDAGDAFTYDLVFANGSSNTVPAFDVVLSDVVPSSLTATGVAIQAQSGVTGLSPSLSGNTVTVNAAQVNSGGSFTVRVSVTATIAVNPSQVIGNTVNSAWTTLPGTNGTTSNPTGSSTPGAAGSGTGERTGSGGVNNLAGSGSVNVTVPNPTLAKVITATSLPHSAGADVVPGEVVDYRVTVTLPEGTQPAFNLTDDIPAGMEYVAGSIALDTTGFGGTVAAPSSNEPSGEGNDLVLGFGQVVVNGDNNTTNNSFAVTYRLRVLQAAGNTNGTVRTNTVSGLGTQASRSVTVRRVDLTLTKSDGGASVSPGGTVTYTLGYGNSGGIAATGVVLTETVPANATFVAAGSTAGWSCADGSPAGTPCTLALGTVAPAGTGTATFVVRAVAPFPAGPTQLSNSTSITDDGVSWVDQVPSNNSATDTTPLQFGTLGDKVFHDIDGNGAFSTGEGLSGVTVTVVWAGPDGNLATTADNVTYTTTTDATGTWTVSRLPAGTFRTTVDTAGIPAGLANTVDPDGGGDSTAVVALAAGATDLAQDFGYRGTASLGDEVFLDADNDGTFDTGEGLAGVGVTVIWAGPDGNLATTADNVTYTTTTDATGTWTVANLPAGTFSTTVNTATLPAGVTPSSDPDGIGTPHTATTTLTTGQIRTDQDFGYRGTGSIGDRVFFDADGNGSWSAGEGLAGIDVTVRWAGPNGTFGDGDDVTSTTTTGADGAWTVTGLPAGSHRVTVDSADLPAGLVPTADPDGTGTPHTSTTTLTAGQDRTDQDFGYRGTGTLGDTIFEDVDDDGSPGVGEGLDGVSVTVTWAGPNGILGDGDDIVMPAVTTAGGGLWSVGQLPAGTFRVDVSGVPVALVNNTVDPDGGGDSTSVVVLGAGGTNLAQDFGYRRNNTTEAVDDLRSTPPNTPIVVDVQANDVDAEGDTQTVISNTQPASGGTAMLNGDGTITYTPPTNFSGYDVFTYTIRDSYGTTGTATVRIIVPATTSLISNDRMYYTDLGGTTPCAEPCTTPGTYDQIQVAEPVRLEQQELVIRLRDGFFPSNGDTFDVMTAPSMSGHWARVRGRIVYDPSSGRIAVFRVRVLADRTRLTAIGGCFVDTDADTVDANIGDGTCADADGRTSLRAAAQELAAGAGDTAIVLPPGQTLPLTIAGGGEDAGATGDVDLSNATDVVGQGATISAAGLGDRAVHVTSGAASFDDLTIRDGAAPGDSGGGLLLGGADSELVDVVVTANTAASGGGVAVTAGNVTVKRGALTANSATGDGGNLGTPGGTTVLDATTITEGTAANGAGLSVGGGTLELRNTTVADNDATNTAGGAFVFTGGSITAFRTTFATNTAPVFGGGILVWGGTATLRESRISANSSGFGGGAAIVSGAVTVERTTFDANVATTQGGALGTASSGGVVDTSTFSGNTSPQGAALFATTGSAGLAVTNTTITANSSSAGAAVRAEGGTITLTSSIVADQLAGAACTIAGGTVASGGYNHASDTTCGLTAAGDVQGGTAGLGVLRKNGGYAPTHLPANGSVVINTGSPTCVGPDQRGWARPRGAACEKGSIER